jgi:hypothetical protein
MGCRVYPNTSTILAWPFKRYRAESYAADIDKEQKELWLRWMDG